MIVDPSTLGPPTTASPSPNSSSYESTQSKAATSPPSQTPSVKLVHPLPTKLLPTPPRLTGSNNIQLKSRRRSQGTLILSAGLASQTGKRTGPPPSEPLKSPTARRSTPYPPRTTAEPSGPRTRCRPDDSAKCGQCGKIGHSLVFCQEYQC